MHWQGAPPKHVEYRRFAEQNRQIEGWLALSALPRVVAVTARPPRSNERVAVALQFAEDAQRSIRVRGKITTTLSLVCQRCLRPFEQQIDADVAGVICADDEATTNVARADEPILAQGDTLDVHALIGDELLLALPPIARCARSDCSARHAQAHSDSEAAPETDQRNPFASLAQLKRED